MSKEILLNLAAVISLLPILILGFNLKTKSETTYWYLLFVAISGPSALIIYKLSGTWQTDLGTAIWATIAITIILFALISFIFPFARPLGPLICSYLIFLGIIGIIWDGSSKNHSETFNLSGVWIWIHIVLCLITYGLITISAIASLCATYQENSFKEKLKNPINSKLPSVIDCDTIVVRLLTVSEVILGLGLISGMTIEYFKYQHFLSINHKTIFVISAFIIIGTLLILHSLIGVRGRRAARYVLSAHLLLTLGYLGVKFISSVL